MEYAITALRVQGNDTRSCPKNDMERVDLPSQNIRLLYQYNTTHGKQKEI